MTRNICFFLFLFFLFGCDSVEPPSLTNHLDPESPNPVDVRPMLLKIASSGSDYVVLSWTYLSHNQELFAVERYDSLNNKKKYYNSSINYLKIDSLDRSIDYTFRVQAVYKDIKTGFSDPLTIKFNSQSSFNLINSKQFPLESPSNYIACSPDNSFVGVLSDGIKIRANRLNYKLMNTLQSSSNKFFFANYDKNFLVENSDSKIDLYETSSWNIEKTLNSAMERYASNNTNTRIAVSDAEIINIINLPAGNIIKTLYDYKNTSALKFSDDGKFLFVSDALGHIKIIDCNDWTEIKSYSINEPISAIDISPNNQYLLYTFDDKLEILDLTNEEIVKQYTSSFNIPILKGLFTANPNIVLLAAGKRIVKISIDNVDGEEILISSNIEIANFQKDKTNLSFLSSGDPVTHFTIAMRPNGVWTD